MLDWGTSGIGDPAIEMRVAWSMFSPPARAAYREALDVDDAMWEQGKGWVLTSVTALIYHRDTNPALVDQAITGTEAVLADGCRRY